MSNGLLATLAAWVSKVKTDVAAILVDTAAIQPLVSLNLDAKISEIGGGQQLTPVYLRTGTSWTIPADLVNDFVQVTVVGAGGGGGFAQVTNDGAYGGGGGEIIFRALLDTKASEGATSIPYTIGAGGTGKAIGSTGAGTDGGSTTIGRYVAEGGQAGNYSTGGAGGGNTGGASAAQDADGNDGGSEVIGGIIYRFGGASSGSGAESQSSGSLGGNTIFAIGGQVNLAGGDDGGGGGASFGQGGAQGSATTTMLPADGGGGCGGEFSDGLAGQDGADGLIIIEYLAG